MSLHRSGKLIAELSKEKAVDKREIVGVDKKNSTENKKQNNMTDLY